MSIGPLTLALFATLALGAEGQQARTNRFGFSGPEIFPIDNLIGHLRGADFDGDGFNDLAVVNNARSRITILYNRTGNTNAPTTPASAGKRDVNELPADARFRIDSIASEKRISGLAVDDFNGDGRPDLAYYGEPKELVVQLNQGTNWGTPTRWAIDDAQVSANAIGSGDLNGDKLADLVLLAENHVYLLLQQTNGTLGEPQKLPFSGAVKSVQVVDVDGDQANDLLLVNWEDRTPFRFRLQERGGVFGPEVYFPFPAIRSYWADSLVEHAKVQVISIAQNSGRAQVSEFARTASKELSGAFREGQFQVLPLPRTDKARRGLIWADVNNDGQADLLVAEPESGQLSIYLQRDGSLSAPQVHPAFAGISDISVADWNGDGRQEIFLLSADERQVGVTALEESGKMAFPTLVPLEGRPLVLDTGVMEKGGKPLLAMVVDQDGRRSLVVRGADGKTRTQKLNEAFKANPSTLRIHDADQDGLPDLVILSPYENVKILRQVPGKDFEEIDVPPPGGVLEQPWMGNADIDADQKQELLLTQRNFLRAVVLRQDAGVQNTTNRSGWTFQVKEQINGAGSNSRLAGAAAVPNGTNATASLFLLDSERKALTLCERGAAGLWEIRRNIPIPYSSFSGIQSLTFGKGAPNAVALLGLNAAGWLRLQGDVWDLVPLDGYETPIKDGHLNDVVTGDLDNDGRKDLVFLETSKNYLDIVRFTAEQKLVPTDRWQVFEERTFRSRRNDLPEPREALVMDFNGDKKNDLAVVVHDRILVYLQE